MIKRTYVAQAVAAALLFAAAGGKIAFAAEEIESNDPIAAAQRVEISNGGAAELSGRIGVEALSASPIADLDFFWFEGSEGDVVTLDIDGGMKLPGSSVRSVDTVLAIFGPGPTFRKLRENDDAGLPLDPGSDHPRDARITNFRLPETGRYVVGVSSFPRFFRDGGGVSNPTSLGTNANGSYKLLISGVTPPVVQVNIEVKPGSDEVAPVNPKSKGNIPVALLSSAQFDALKANRATITFGATGNERSLLRCGKDGTDVNGDGRMDLICQFDNQLVGFEPGDLEGTVRGYTGDGRRFEGTGLIKVVPGKREF